VIGLRITQPCTIHHWTKLPTKNELGDEQWGWVDEAGFIELQQHSATELRRGQVVALSQWAGFFRPDVTLTNKDEVTVPGSGRFTFDGDPWLVRNPRTAKNSHWYARMRRTS
jgi:hypothetical protein